MTINEKAEEIKKAVQSGVAKRAIDRKGNGVNVRRLLEGKKVAEECIEEIYANLFEYRKSPGERKARLEKYSHSHSEVSQKEKVKAIRKAIKSGMKKSDLDPFGGGDAVRKLEKGEPVGAYKINEMYEKLLSLKHAAGKVPAKKKAKRQKKQVSKKGEAFTEKKFVEQKEQISTLLEKVKILEEKVIALSGVVNTKTPLKVLGLTVTQKLDIVKGKGYRRWYAIYRENGTRQWIYIGKDVNKAEEKIQSWLEKRRSNHV
ncbi:MAG: hypothetical protein HUU50_22435 [Candidatus Brocadiae bacterium]|nr:hypothetical protein [Candidatus Brocadiia bacterium]